MRRFRVASSDRTALNGTEMRAVVQREYGSPDTLRVEEVARPEPGAGEVLVRVRAASVNQGDWHLMRGLPYLVRLLGFGLRRPKHPVPGQYAAGTVEAVGDGVLRLRPGEDVFGSCKGAFAEYVCAREDAFAARPHDVSFEQAAAVPHGGFAALQALRDAGRVRAGQKVLVLGASGAVGSMAVQIARSFDAEVTGVARTAKLDLVRSLGADRVLDAEKIDAVAGGMSYDVVLDTVGDRSPSRYRSVLTPSGRVVMVSGGRGRWLGGMHRVLGAAVLSLFSRRKLVPFLAVPKLDDLVTLQRLLEQHDLTPIVAGTWPLAETADAFRHLESRQAQGAIVVAP